MEPERDLKARFGRHPRESGGPLLPIDLDSRLRGNDRVIGTAEAARCIFGFPLAWE